MASALFLSQEKPQQRIRGLDILGTNCLHHTTQAVVHDDIPDDILQGRLLGGRVRVGTGALAQRGVGKEGLHLGHPALADQLEGELAGHAGRQRVDLGGDERGVRLPGSRVLHPAHFGGNAQR